MSKLQTKPSAFKGKHPALKRMKFIDFFLCLWVIFPFWIRTENPDPDTDPGTPQQWPKQPQHRRQQLEPQPEECRWWCGGALSRARAGAEPGAGGPPGPGRASPCCAAASATTPNRPTTNRVCLSKTTAMNIYSTRFATKTDLDPLKPCQSYFSRKSF
jgi:hypothetical protein